MRTRIFGMDGSENLWKELQAPDDIDGFHNIMLLVDAEDAQIYEDFFNSLDNQFVNLPLWVQNAVDDTRLRLKKTKEIIR